MRRDGGPPSGIGDGRPVQAGCGAIFGVFVGLGCVGGLGWGTGSWPGMAVAVGLPALLFALFAWQWGDRFWERYLGD